ncbi:MAG: hypothetical protein LBD27_06920 [Tannerella sp.]|nr:hypothetical protein [Tannerella sp.]
MLKCDITSWDTGLNDKKLVNRKPPWVMSKERGAILSGCLTKGDGFRIDDTPFDESTSN